MYVYMYFAAPILFLQTACLHIRMLDILTPHGIITLLFQEISRPKLGAIQSLLRVNVDIVAVLDIYKSWDFKAVEAIESFVISIDIFAC